MCGSFTCSKNTLVGINVIYILVSFLMIGVAVHGKVSGIVTSLPIIGGITACGIFLLMISVIGLIGTVRHHQVLLFFYMVVLFLIFLIQFSVSCAALAIDEPDEKQIILTAWKKANTSSPSLVVQAERSFDCCGVGLTDTYDFYDKPTPADIKWSFDNEVFKDTTNTPDCHGLNATDAPPSCSSCFSHISGKVNYAFNAAGGVGLFFSFTELVGGLVAYRYRNLLDPFAAPPAGAPFTGSM